MATIPRDPTPESSLAFLTDPYRFIGRRARRLRSPVFSARLMARPTICMTGAEAASLFYDTSRMQRQGAMPLRVRGSLLGEGGVQGLDGETHRVRKAMFLSTATGQGVDRLLEISARQWHDHARDWEGSRGVPLYQAACSVLARSACEWAGVPLPEDQAERRIRQVVALFDGAGAVGPRHWRSRLSRVSAEHWIAGLVDGLRAGQLECAAEAPLAIVAAHRDANGALLDARTAAVEVLNLIRPITAVAVYVVLVAHALQMHPRARRPLRGGEAQYAERFVEEVRRFYPFFPAVAARTRAEFSWNGLDFPADQRVMFDLYGTNRDPQLWSDPERFDPDRFEGPFDRRFALVPQGGGEHADGHRCPGEWITLALMRQAAGFLAAESCWDAPDQPSDIDYRRMPALPQRPFVLRDFRLA